MCEWDAAAVGWSCTNFTAGGAGCPDTDTLIVVSALATDYCGGAELIAYAGACRTDAVSDRPLAAYVNFCPYYLADVSAAGFRAMLKVRGRGCRFPPVFCSRRISPV